MTQREYYESTVMEEKERSEHDCKFTMKHDTAAWRFSFGGTWKTAKESVEKGRMNLGRGFWQRGLDLARETYAKRSS